MVSTLVQNTQDVGSIPTSHFHQTYDDGCHDHDPVQATRCIVVEPTLCMFM